MRAQAVLINIILKERGVSMVPISTYVFIYGVPCFAILFSIVLYFVGGKIFKGSDNDSA